MEKINMENSKMKKNPIDLNKIVKTLLPHKKIFIAHYQLWQY